jgi:hypothetical protein
MKTTLLPFAFTACLIAQQPAQQTPPAKEPATGVSSSASTNAVPGEGRWFHFGFRVRGFPQGLFERNELEVKTTTPPIDAKYKTTPTVNKAGWGPSFEITPNKKFTLSVELLHHAIRYKKESTVFEGIDNPATAVDERRKTVTEEGTKASLWDIPVMARYHGIRSGGFLGLVYLSGGMTMRHIRNIRTGTGATLPSNQVVYNENPIVPEKKNVFGGTVGLGIRIVDESGLKLTPEVRYTRWMGATFDRTSTHTVRGQLEVGLGVTF